MRPARSSGRIRDRSKDQEEKIDSPTLSNTLRHTLLRLISFGIALGKIDDVFIHVHVFLPLTIVWPFFTFDVLDTDRSFIIGSMELHSAA
jgi:hypothetical protein